MSLPEFFQSEPDSRRLLHALNRVLVPDQRPNIVDTIPNPY